MKKTMFAAKVFGLVIMLPLIVVIEMNHVPAGAAGNNTLPGIQQPVHSTVGLPAKADGNTGHDAYGPAPESILLKSAY